MLGRVCTWRDPSVIGKIIEFKIGEKDIFEVPFSQGETSVFTHIDGADYGGQLIPSKYISLSSTQTLEESMMVQELLDKVAETEVLLIPGKIMHTQGSDVFGAENTFLLRGEKRRDLETLSRLERTLRTLCYEMIASDDSIIKDTLLFENPGYRTSDTRLSFREAPRAIWEWTKDKGDLPI